MFETWKTKEELSTEALVKDHPLETIYFEERGRPKTVLIGYEEHRDLIAAQEAHRFRSTGKIAHHYIANALGACPQKRRTDEEVLDLFEYAFLVDRLFSVVPISATSFELYGWICHVVDWTCYIGQPASWLAEKNDRVGMIEFRKRWVPPFHGPRKDLVEDGVFMKSTRYMMENLVNVEGSMLLSVDCIVDMIARHFKDISGHRDFKKRMRKAVEAILARNAALMDDHFQAMGRNIRGAHFDTLIGH